MGRLRAAGLLAGAMALSGGGLVALPTAANAAGTLFSPYVSYDPGAPAANTAMGDVTGDGRPDVVLTTDYELDSAAAYSLWVYPELVDGTLGRPTQVKTQATYGSDMTVALADIDEDGDLDAAVATEAGVELYAQTSGGLSYTWTVPVEEAHDLELVDVSGDGLADLVANGVDGIEVWWQIKGDFMWSPTGRLLGAEPWDTDVEVADVTGDGLADVVTADDAGIEVRAQRADQSFSPAVGYTSGVSDEIWGTHVNGLAVGDTDGDGRADVHVSVGGNTPNSWVVTRSQQPDGTLGAPLVRQSYDIPEALQVADVTGDGRGDLVVVHGGWNRVGVYDSTPGIDPAEELYAASIDNGVDLGALAVGDVSGDGRADVAVADRNHGLVLLRGAKPGADITPPETSIASGPSGTYRSRTATFEFTATETSTFTCALDGAAWAPCKSPMTYSGLAAGSHTFRVRATDLAGNTDASPAQRTFFVDGPETTITSGPTGTIRSTSATFAFSGSPTPTYFECSMDGSAWQRCSSQVNYSGLATGTSHTFQVRGVSADGLADSTPASRSFTVDTAADLAVTLGAAPDPVKRGSTLTYTARVSNVGPNAASNVVLTQGMPSGVGFTSVSATLDSPASSTGSCTASGSPATVRCELGNLNPGDTWTVTVVGTVTASKGSLSSTAVVTTPTWDLSSANDSASTSTSVGGGKGR
ncbi:MAG TPA: FG-GAP-like repeat-containing protein [Nocardioidaceae bacterium]|nr:FG-GAP-like repeat-containing protein [Nocardioidaceae bacterium]